MPNANVARGLVPYRHFDGSVWNGSVNMYYIPSGYGVNLFIGDPVDIISSSNDANGIPAVKLGVVGSPIIGSIVNIVAGGDPQIAVTRDMPIYHPANTAQYVLVSDDPTLLYMVQDDASTQATAPNLWAGKNAALVAGSGSTNTGYSGWQMAASTVAVGNTLDVKIMRPLPEVDNIVSNVANTNMNAKWLVKLNNYRYANQIAGI